MFKTSACIVWIVLVVVTVVHGFQPFNVECRRKSLVLNASSARCTQEDSSPLLVSRGRRLLLNIAFASGWAGVLSNPVAAEESFVLVRGTVRLQEDSLVEPSATAALYVTCRPDKPDNVPVAILSGTRGKPPPVLAARFENPSFPFDFELVGPDDLTPEGASDSSAAPQALDPSQFWWKNDDLIVSARWDSDGVAATRSPDDLVGRGVFKHGDARVDIPLTGRGAFGKFATGGSSKK